LARPDNSLRGGEREYGLDVISHKKKINKTLMWKIRPWFKIINQKNIRQHPKLDPNVNEVKYLVRSVCLAKSRGQTATRTPC
jgi:hypothetical protein